MSDPSAPDPTEIESVEKSTLDRDALRARLEAWLASVLPGDATPRISELSTPSGTGMSSETLLFDLDPGDGSATIPLVGRVAPKQSDVPVFPDYDFPAQYRVLETVAKHGDVPVPGVRWLETDASAIGAPFFVMDRVTGRVPDDIPPYVFAGWVFEASDAERAELESSTVEAIAALHAIDAVKADAGFLEFDVAGDTPLARHVQNQRDFYAWVTSDGHTHPLIERTFGWLEANWPEDEGETVISWGDARIGNVLYDGFRPAALLDWEMAALAPREMDLGWVSFMHRFFQDLAEGAGLPGLPDLLQLSNVAAHYERASGHTPNNLRWHYTYAALRHAIIMARIHRRMVHFGQAEATADPDASIPHHALLERMLDGSWDPLS